jgi:hypothetical protein
MKSKISDRPMFKKGDDEMEVENVGIMQGFMDEMEAEDAMEDDEDYQTEKMLDRRPNSPEILMNNLRGDMRSIDARVEELADLVGYNAAADTPENVLALLQPVLAAQQAPQGGIPAAMPPQEMMPPPPMPPEMMGGMPPEAAMGGIGALPADQGPMMEEPMPAPVAMAMGGYVQRFSEGTDEDGVTPIENTSSFPAGSFSPDMINRARAQIINSLNQKPLTVPDISAQTESRIPLYEKLLGVDKNINQAQILFELGQRAFNYGANVDDQGNPLRGSQAARLAGAVRTLPGAMGNIIGQQAQQDRAVKGMALQAAEKDVQNIREQNARIAAVQQRLQSDVLKSASAGNKMFGSGLEGTAQALLVNLSPAYAKGETSADQDRAFESAVAIVSQPTQYTDPYTGNVVTRTPVIPDYVKQALSSRGKVSTTIPTVEKPGSVVAVAEPGSGDRAQQEDIARRFKTAKADFKAGKIPKAEYDTLVATLNEESKQVKAAVENKKDVPKAGTPVTRSIWDSADLVAGPISSLTAGVSRVPGLGNVGSDVQQARSYVKTAVNDLVSNLRTNDKFTETERSEIKSQIDIGPSFFDNPTALKNRIIGISDFLEKKIQEEESKINDTTLPVTIRQNAADRLVDLQKFSTTFGVPIRIYSEEDARLLPKGTKFLWNGVEPRTRK